MSAGLSWAAFLSLQYSLPDQLVSMSCFVSLICFPKLLKGLASSHLKADGQKPGSNASAEKWAARPPPINRLLTSAMNLFSQAQTPAARKSVPSSWHNMNSDVSEPSIPERNVLSASMPASSLAVFFSFSGFWDKESLLRHFNDKWDDTVTGLLWRLIL